MANTVTSWNGQSNKMPIEVVGQMLPLVAVKVLISGTTTSEAITFPSLGSIMGWNVQVIDTNNRVGTSDIAVTASGNVLTLADGATFNLDASGHKIYVLVWGTPKV